MLTTCTCVHLMATVGCVSVICGYWNDEGRCVDSGK